MANPVRGEVSLTLSGKEYPLRISLNVLAETQEMLGLNDFNEVMARLSPDPETGRQRADFIMLRALVCAVLREHLPGLKPAQAGAMIGVADIRPTMDAIAMALDRAFAGPGGDEQENPADPQPAAA